MIPTDWKVALVDDFLLDSQRLLIYRPAGDYVDVITGFTPDGHALVERQDPLKAHDWRGFRIPNTALDALADRLKPGPTAAELARLTNALDRERYRVDRILDAAVDVVRIAAPQPEEDTPR